MKTEFTPGPWRVYEGTAFKDSCESEVITDEKGETGAVVICRGSGCNHSANARLIAAAPALFEALVDVLGACDAQFNGLQLPDTCRWCGRELENGDFCLSDDCPGYMARQTVAKALGQ